MITIGDTRLPTRRPADLDAKLIETSGCNATEHVQMLKSRPTPFGIARALAPFVTENTVGEIASLMAQMTELTDLYAARDEVIALLAGGSSDLVEEPAK